MHGRLSLGLGLSRKAAAVVSSNLYPDPNIDDSGNYTYFGACTAVGGDPTWVAGGSTATVQANNTLLDAINAALANSTAYNCSVFVTGYVSGNIQMRLKGGTYTSLAVSANGWSAPVPITSGVATAFTIRGDAGAVATLGISAISITA